MPYLTLYFQLHQPYRLHPDTSKFLWEEHNRDHFKTVANECILPATWMFAELISDCPQFKLCLGMSGVFLEQAERYQPEVVFALQELLDTDKETGQVEYLEETYYHSLAGLFQDPEKKEFRDQVSLHRQKMVQLFGLKPTSFRNTELMYNNEVAHVVADMGFKAILCELPDDTAGSVCKYRGHNGQPRELTVLARHRKLSQALELQYSQAPIQPADYAAAIAKAGGNAVMLGYDYLHLGSAAFRERGIFEFWKALPEALEQHETVTMVNPTELAEQFKNADCPAVDVPPLRTTSWSPAGCHAGDWLGTSPQQTLFKELEEMERSARTAGDSFLNHWRLLMTADHLYSLHEGPRPGREAGEDDGAGDSPAEAAFLMTRNLDILNQSIRSFNILKRTPTTPVIIITPEIDRLPSEGMGQFAQFVSGKSGGMGQVVSAICKGLTDRKIAAHLITLNLQRRFREEAKISDTEWIQNRHKLDPQYIHLVTSSIFEEYHSAYDGNPIETAAEFQRAAVNTYIKEIRSKYGGRGIIHSHDWMAGGIIASYANKRNIQLLHTVHNTHTANIPLSMLHGVNLNKFRDACYLQWDGGQECIDSQATAIKNATAVSYVGQSFLDEVVNDYFLDRSFIPWSVRQETKARYHAGAVMTVYNGISPDEYPEHQPENPNYNQPGLARRFGPDDDVVYAKKLNLIKFQTRMGLRVDPEAILFFWPSRLDPTQKGVELLEDIALKFVVENGDAQIAIVGNPVGSDRRHAEIIGRIACASEGKIAYSRYSEDLCKLGYAAACDVFGASLYEPFGQIDVMGNLYGATATNRATGGYSDKISRLSLKARGAPKDTGNGILFRDYDPCGLWYGLNHSLAHHRFFHEHQGLWEEQATRIMVEARKRWDLDTMVARYLSIYEQINDGTPLT